MVAAGEESQDAMESKTEAASVYGNASCELNTLDDVLHGFSTFCRR